MFQNQDKIYHFLAGYAIAILVSFFAPQLMIPSAATIAILKEIYDHYHKEIHTPDWNDVLFTILGGLTFSVQFLIPKIT